MKITKEEEFFSDEGKYEALGGFSVQFKLTNLASLWDAVTAVHRELFSIALDYEDFNFKYKIYLFEEPDAISIEYTRSLNDLEKLAIIDVRKENNKNIHRYEQR